MAGRRRRKSYNSGIIIDQNVRKEVKKIAKKRSRHAARLEVEEKTKKKKIEKLHSTNYLLENNIRIVNDNDLSKKVELIRNGTSKYRATRSETTVEFVLNLFFDANVIECLVDGINKHYYKLNRHEKSQYYGKKLLDWPKIQNLIILWLATEREGDTLGKTLKTNYDKVKHLSLFKDRNRWIYLNAHIGFIDICDLTKVLDQKSNSLVISGSYIALDEATDGYQPSARVKSLLQLAELV